MGIEEIASQLGISTTTVSRAISGRGRVSPETRKRVLDLTAETGFVPNASASSLVTTRTHTIAYAMPLSEDSIRFSFFPECMFGIQKAVTAQGYHLTVVDSNIAELTRTAASHRVDGIILGSFDGTDEDLKGLLRFDLPLVLIGTTGVHGVTQVQYDFRPGFLALTASVYAMWRCPIALLLSDRHYRANISRADCFREVAMRQGTEDPVVVYDLMGEAEITETLPDLYSRGIRGVICGDEAICQNVFYTMLKSLRTPGDPMQAMWSDLHIAAFHTSRTDRAFFPEVPTLVGDTVALGQEAGTLLLDRIQGRACPESINLKPQMIFQTST